MANHRKEPWHKVLVINEIFYQDDFIILTLPNQQFPMKFHPQIYKLEKTQIGLRLPLRWWQFFEFTVGMNVRLTKLHHDGVFFISGTINQVNFNKLPSISVHHDGAVKRDQRRFFYRVTVEHEFIVKDILLPEGQRIMNCPAYLHDVSAGGIGFGVKTFLPPGTTITVKNFLYPLLPEEDQVEYELQVLWCRVDRIHGYRVGACFNYPDVKEQDDMVGMINQVQRIKMNKYYHIKHT